MPDNSANERVSFMTVANLLSMARLVVVLPELYFASVGNETWFLALVAFALFTDSIDGTIARWLRQDSILGAKLDSLGDLATYISIPIGGWLLWPDIFIRERVFVVMAVMSYLLPATIGLIRYRRLTSFHTWGAKLSAILMGAAVLILFVTHSPWSPWPFRIFSPVAALAGLEEIAITFTLRNWHANIPSIWHARRIRAGLLPAPPVDPHYS